MPETRKNPRITVNNITMPSVSPLSHPSHKNAPKPLPPGWKWVKLGEVISEAQTGFACGQRDSQGVIQLRMNNVDTWGNISFIEFIRVPADSDTINRYRLLPNDVMFNNTNSTELVGKSALFNSYDEEVVFSNHFTRLRTNIHSLTPELLVAWLNHKWQEGVFARICNRWIGQSGIKSDKLLSLKLPLPPLPEQKRIAAILREQLSSVDRARKAAEERLEAIKALPTAFLRRVFPQYGQPLPEGWKWVKLTELSIKIDYGYTASADYTIKSPKFLRITDIQNGNVNWRIVPGCSIEPSLINDYQLMNGDIVFARTGATTGKSFQIIDPPEAVFASYLIRVKVDQKKIYSDFLYAFFQSDGYWNVINAGMRGGALAGFNASMLKNVEIPITILPEQRRIVSIIKDQIVSVEKARKAAEEELKTINAIPAAILRKAFNGEF